MVLTSIAELATGFEGCEKKIEVDFELNHADKQLYNTNAPQHHRTVGLRRISRASIDRFLALARCTVISVTSNDFFDAYVLSESSLFIYPNKAILKTCGTTLLLKSLPELLAEAKAVCGAEPDFLQFSRSNFIFPNKQLYPHRAFGEETDYLGKVLQPLLYSDQANEELNVDTLSDQVALSKAVAKQGVQSSAYILGPINGPRWHLYTVDWDRIVATDYTQQTLEIVMFNLDATRMRTFYRRTDDNSDGTSGIGSPCSNGEEATTVSGIDQLLPGSIIDSNLFTPCGYSCNGLLDGAYFTIHITPEPECSFVSFETNAVMKNYTELVKKVIATFKPNNWTMSLFVDEKSEIPDSRAGCAWQYAGYNTTGTTNHIFPSQYNATCAQFESNGAAAETISPIKRTAAYGTAVDRPGVLSPGIVSYNSQLHQGNGISDHETLIDVPTMSLNSYSYETIAAMSLLQMRELVISTAVGRYTIEPSNVIPMNTDTENVAAVDTSDIVRSSAVTIISQHLPEQSFTLVDIGQLVRKFYTWARVLSRITPVYHVNTHIDKGIISSLSVLGTAFACNSVAATRSLLRMGVNAPRITMNSPHLPISTLQFCREKNVELITVHTTHELQQIKTHYHTADLLILYSFGYEHTLGVDSVHDLQSIVKQATTHDLHVTGIRLNLPSSLSISQLLEHLHTIRAAIDECKLKIEVLDLGTYNLSVDTASLDQCKQLMKVLNEQFSGIEILANCEQYMNDHTSGLSVNVLEKRVHNKDNSNGDSTNGSNGASGYNGLGKRKHADVTYYVADDTLTDTLNYRNEVIASLTQQKPHANKASSSAICSVSSNLTAYIDELAIPTTNQYEWIYLPNIDPITPTKLTDAPDVYYIAS